jgi:hypothetical protein
MMYKFRTHILIFINYIFLVLCPYIYHIFLSHKAKEKTKKHKNKAKRKNKETQKQSKKKKHCHITPGELHTKFARDTKPLGPTCQCIPGEPDLKFARGKLHGPTCHRDRHYPWRIPRLMPKFARGKPPLPIPVRLARSPFHEP